MNTEKEDIPVMLDCLQELFNEYGDTVTPTLLVERMESKLHRHVSMHVVAYQYTSLGFVTKRLNGNNSKYNIIPNRELLAEKRAQFCKVNKVNYLKTNDRSKFRAKKEDIVALLDALQELFKEHTRQSYAETGRRKDGTKTPQANSSSYSC